MQPFSVITICFVSGLFGLFQILRCLFHVRFGILLIILKANNAAKKTDHGSDQVKDTKNSITFFKTISLKIWVFPWKIWVFPWTCFSQDLDVLHVGLRVLEIVKDVVSRVLGVLQFVPEVIVVWVVTIRTFKCKNMFDPIFSGLLWPFNFVNLTALLTVPTM